MKRGVGFSALMHSKIFIVLAFSKSSLSIIEVSWSSSPKICCCWWSCCYWLPAVDGVLAVASIPSDPGVPFLAVGFTYWIVE
jgi:hypothetical protein